MIWLGRIDFRLIETTSNGKQMLRRNQVEAMVALRSLFDEKLYQKYLSFDDAITAFVGEHDYMRLQEVDSFDSHVFSKVVYDRLPTRVLPNPLDVGFAALGNNQALSLLGDELDTESGLPGALASMRLVVDSHWRKASLDSPTSSGKNKYTAVPRMYPG